ncbi:MAG: prepilin-type N-terminal cleavage/methylation domain-containing protein [Aquabacterium sp.]|nr:MAG: prepilin-type N-terminal cleavage/methylation domain-containing protein [Aquabacterium sp.]
MASATSNSLVKRGFTLIELMIVVALIGILAAIAVPSYNDYIRRGQIQEAFTFLGDYRVKMEQYYQDNKNYGDAAGTACATNAASWNAFNPGAQRFTFSCVTSDSGQRFVVTATSTAGLSGGSHIYTVDQTGTKRTTTFKGSSVAKTCWVLKGSEC